MKLRPAVVVLIIGIIVFLTGISLISIGVNTELPVFDNKSHVRQGYVSAYKNDTAMIAAGIGMTVAGLGLTVAGGLYSRRKRG